ncbi:hypothetical protein SteCoe_8531 [Stentor coeruleus]|uniref:HMG box domain-containing protein n=1 Tax=Stentor coeruleus TaxID=5963 RepID=A0A1R2CJY8_9CILI|nr:hypothetical protein SteCoe_8531 [Stentor coeruleus]
MNKKEKRDSSKEYKWDTANEKYIPKASPLAYTLFINDRKEEYNKNPEKFDGGKLYSTKQLARKINSDWKKLDDGAKKKYKDIVEKEKKRFEIQKKELEDKGYFTLSCGTKSTDLPAPEVKNTKRRSMTPVKQESKRPANKKK